MTIAGSLISGLSQPIVPLIARPKGWRHPVMEAIAVVFVSFCVFMVYAVVGSVLG